MLNQTEATPSVVIRDQPARRIWRRSRRDRGLFSFFLVRLITFAVAGLAGYAIGLIAVLGR
jgi:hypothetical protein